MEYGIMHIDVHQHAKQDLSQLWTDNPKAAASIEVILEQLAADPKVIDKLTTYGDNMVGENLINVKSWQKVRGIADLWRFRILETPATTYRIIYGYHWPTTQLCVFAVVEKEIYDYDNLESSINKRILADWRDLD